MTSYTVRDPIDVLHVQRCVGDFAREMGFSRIESQELAIVATELATNILKFGAPGTLQVQELLAGQVPYLKLTATDSGPPFKNLQSAIQDGWDDDGPIDPLQLLKRQGIGGGLGAIVRFSHSFVVAEGESGKAIVIKRYRGDEPPPAEK